MNGKSGDVTPSQGSQSPPTDTQAAHPSKPGLLLGSAAGSQQESHASAYEKNKAKKIKDLLNQI